MRLRRSFPIVAAVLLVVIATTLAVILRKHAPPEAARLLPGADGFVYFNFQWMRRANLLGELPPVPHDPEYEHFIEQTGFQFERDLDEAALAIHYSGPDLPPRFSEIFVGKIDGERLRAYLAKLANATENYRSVDIYSIPVEGHTLRVAMLGLDTVAASNIDAPQMIYGIIGRSRKLASPFAGPALLRQNYKHVPLASLAWGILRVPAQPGVHISSWGFGFQKAATVVASVRYFRELHLQTVAFTDSDADAKHVVDQFTTFFDLFRAAEVSTGAQTPDPDVKALFDSLKIEQQKDRAVLTATVPVGFLRKALAEAPVAETPEAPSEPAREAAPQANSGKRQKKEGSAH